MNPPRFLLLFGTPRSGTSWLGKIFDSHPRTVYKHEPDRSWKDVSFAPPLADAERLRIPILTFAARLANISTAHAAGRLPVFAKQYRGRIPHSIHRLSVVTVGLASAVGFRLPVLQCADVDKRDVCVVWKSTDSLDRLGVILRTLEDCRAIRILRHPCGYISSVLRGEAQRKFISAVPASEDYGIMQILLQATAHPRGLTVDLLRQCHPVERMAWIWVLMNEKAAEDTASDDRCTWVRYEDVCRAPVSKVKELFNFCGLSWNSQTANFINASTLASQGRAPQISHQEQRYYSVFRDPLKSANKWKSELKPEDIERVYRVLRQSDLIRLYPESEDVPWIQPVA
jgi:hypothetical protein